MSKFHATLALVSLVLAAVCGSWSLLILAGANASLAVVFADNGNDD